MALALNRGTKQSFTAENFMPSVELEDDSIGESDSDNLEDETFSPLFEYLTESEAEALRRISADYKNKTEAEKTVWRKQILDKIGTDEQLIDKEVHSSHIHDALQKEIPAIQKIISKSLPPSYKSPVDTFTGERKKISDSPELKTTQDLQEAEKALKKLTFSLEKTIRRTFAKQFVALRNLPKPTAFDRLSGTQLARLIRLSGIREVALACVRIEAVEAVAAFLRRFPAEDARAIATQINNLRKTPESRLAFAEHLVQTTIEIESEPSAMLDLLGIWLVGIFLCDSTETRVRYTNQKLPLEIVTKLPEIIDRQYQNTPEDMQKKISSEIEHLAETIAQAEMNINSAVNKTSSNS